MALQAAAVAFLGASSLILGALIALTGRLTGRPLSLLIAFGSGALVSAVAYDLVEEAVNVSATGLWVGAGFAAGALTYFVGDELIDRLPGGQAMESGGGLAILLGAVLDGIPESIVLGLTLGTGGPIAAILVAIFISNVPESVAGSTKMLAGGRRPRWVVGVWVSVAVVSAVAAGFGASVLADAPGDVIAFIDAFAAGAILVLLADDLLPEAHGESDKVVGLATALGFAVAAVLSFSS
ncbi:MAG: ZIP family metal transporter [Chloroflexota bacterium]